LYYVPVHPLAQKVLDHVRRLELLKAGDRVGVAVSGGADSAALLRILLELRSKIGIVLSVVHFNHKLRGAESDEDEAFIARVAREHKLELHTASADVKAEASAKGMGIEATARELRYGFFQQLVHPEAATHSRLDKIATGHTLDDQAETVLMRIIRGTGMRGLAGIYPTLELEEDGEAVGEVIRPLLEVRHRELEQFLRDIEQPWREDSSNRDQKFTRNRVRRALLPLLEAEFNPSIAEALSELAAIARSEEDYWQNEIAGWMGTAIHWTEPEWAAQGQQGLVQLRPSSPELEQRLREGGPLAVNATVDLVWLLSEPRAVQRRAIKAVAELAGFPLEFKHVEEILRFASDQAEDGKRLFLPLGWQVEREPAALTFLTPDLRTRERLPSDYEYVLPLPGRAMVPEAGIVVEAVPVRLGSEDAGYNPDHLLDPALLPTRLTVRNWRPGDRFWPVHTKSPKKIKELLQERHIIGPIRKAWPVVVSGDEVVWVRGFPAPAKIRAKGIDEAILIREIPLEEED
jgi:tRNA(Ile)-lysidine synthase